MARKWQKQAIKQRKRIPWRIKSAQEVNEAKLPEGEKKGHFVVYSIDKKRFVLPLEYLKNNIFRDLFKLAEEEFGLSSNVPLTLPCDATVIKYVITLIHGSVAKDLEEAVSMSIITSTHRCQSNLDLHQEGINISQHLLCSF